MRFALNAARPAVLSRAQRGITCTDCARARSHAATSMAVGVTSAPCMAIAAAIIPLPTLCRLGGPLGPRRKKHPRARGRGVGETILAVVEASRRVAPANTNLGIALLLAPLAPHLDFAGEVRAATRFPVFHAARIQDVATARHAIVSGKLDMVGMTRAHIADPHIVRKLMAGREDEIRPCVGATYCIDRIYEGNDAVCIHNPATGREGSLPQVVMRTTGPRRKVVVVGAGPAGLEAARVASARGHSVTLFEATEKAGGQILLAVRVPPSAWMTSQSRVIVCSPSFSRSTAARWREIWSRCRLGPARRSKSRRSSSRRSLGLRPVGNNSDPIWPGRPGLQNLSTARRRPAGRPVETNA